MKCPICGKEFKLKLNEWVYDAENEEWFPLKFYCTHCEKEFTIYV